MIWKPGDCYTMTVPLHTAGLLSPKYRVDAGLGAGRQPDWRLDRISGKKVMHKHYRSRTTLYWYEILQHKDHM